MGSTLFVGRVRVDHLLGFSFVVCLCVFYLFLFLCPMLPASLDCHSCLSFVSGLSFVLVLRLWIVIRACPSFISNVDVWSAADLTLAFRVCSSTTQFQYMLTF